MAPGPTASDESDTGVAPIDTFLLRHVQSNPGLRFSPLSRAAQAACKVSRATVTRHLSRLVRFGDLVLLADRTYVSGGSSGPTGRAVLEVRWYDVAIFVQPDGSSRILAQEELRVVSGQLGHLELLLPRPKGRVTWWSTAASRFSQVATVRAHRRRSVPGIVFAEPLTARNMTWQRMCSNIDFPAAYHRMAYTPTKNPGSAGARDDKAHDSDSIGLPSQGRRYGHRIAPDARLRLQVMFPPRYPIGEARCRVSYFGEPNRVDPDEELRLAKAADDSWHQDGLGRFGTTMSLSVPHPLLDRQYGIEWALPTFARRGRWLSDYFRPTNR